MTWIVVSGDEVSGTDCLTQVMEGSTRTWWREGWWIGKYTIQISLDYEESWKNARVSKHIILAPLKQWDEKAYQVTQLHSNLTYIFILLCMLSHLIR